MEQSAIQNGHKDHRANPQDFQIKTSELGTDYVGHTLTLS